MSNINIGFKSKYLLGYYLGLGLFDVITMEMNIVVTKNVFHVFRLLVRKVSFKEFISMTAS